MPQSVQIVPTYHYPYVHTVINDNSQQSSEVVVNQQSPVVSYAFPFTSSKGIDNVFVKKTSLAGCMQTFGESNYKKYGQPYMMALNVLNEENANVWAMRVMPENAAYANSVIILWYKADDENSTYTDTWYTKVPSESITVNTTYTKVTGTVPMPDNMRKVVANEDDVITFTSDDVTASTPGALKVVANEDPVVTYTVAQSTDDGALEVVADGSVSDPTTQVAISDVTATGIEVQVGDYVTKTTTEFDPTTQVALADVTATGIEVQVGAYVVKNVHHFDSATEIAEANVTGIDVDPGDYVTISVTRVGPEGSLLVVANDIKKSRFNAETMVRLEDAQAAIRYADGETPIDVDDFVVSNSEEKTLEPDQRKFRIKYTQKFIENATTVEKFNETVKKISLTPTADGWTPVVFMTIRAEGRGVYGDDFRLKVTQNTSYEKEYGIKMYNFNVLSVENGLTSLATYVGSIVSSVRYESSTLINDVLSSVDAGVAPAIIEVNEDGLEDVYDAYVEFCKAQNVALKTLEASIMDSPEIVDIADDFMKMVDGTIPINPASLKDTVLRVRNIETLIDETETENIDKIDTFDPILGLGVASTKTSDLIGFENGDGLVSFIKNDKGIAIDDGSDGYFAEPRVTDFTGTILERKSEMTTDDYGNQVPARDENGNIKYINDPETGAPIYVLPADRTVEYTEENVKKWTYDEEVEDAYNKAFNGTFDGRILSVRRIGVDAWFDANYPYSVKRTLVDLAVARNDAIVYLDTGITDTSYTTSKVEALVKDYTFDNKLVVVNLQHFKTKEPGTQKKVEVSITYFLARQYASHVRTIGYYIPMVKGRCELSNHVKDSLQPTVDDYQADVKEALYINRFNYFETVGENRFQRGSQVTSQLAETDLAEENNVQTLYKVKKILEDDIADRLYDFTDESTRALFTNYETEKFSSWIGSRFQSIEINFTVNSWEFEHSIVHCYVAIVFRSLQKQAILEIDINKREFGTNSSEDSSDEFKFNS